VHGFFGHDVAQSGGSSSGNPNYFDLRALMFYFRVHA